MCGGPVDRLGRDYLDGLLPEVVLDQWDEDPPAVGELEEEVGIRLRFIRLFGLQAPDEEEYLDDGHSEDSSLSEEDSDEEEVVDGEEDDQRFPQEEFWAGWRAEIPSPVSPEEEHRPPSPAALPLGGSKRHRDEEEEEEPSSKRQRPEDSPDEPATSDPASSPSDHAPSTSAGTSGGFSRHFYHPHLLQDYESDDD